MTHEFLESIRRIGILPTVSFDTVESAVKTAEVLDLQNINIIEVMLRSEASIDAIKAIRNHYPQFIIGAGTIKSIEDVKKAKLAGADFIVLPYWQADVITYCISENMLVIPGVSTAKEIADAEALGLKCVKYFPAEPLGGVEAIKLLSGVFPKMRFIPTGGITKDNFKDYLKVKCILAVGGGFMLDKVALANADYDQVGKYLYEVLHTLYNFRVKHIGINTNSEEQASDIANRLSTLFNFKVNNRSKSIFSSEQIEVMKLKYYGEGGHIGIATDDVDRAYHYLLSNNIKFITDTIAYDKDGLVSVAYIDEYFGGFAIHLMK